MKSHCQSAEESVRQNAKTEDLMQVHMNNNNNNTQFAFSNI